jgi:hypothetical protein
VVSFPELRLSAIHADSTRQTLKLSAIAHGTNELAETSIVSEEQKRFVVLSTVDNVTRGPQPGGLAGKKTPFLRRFILKMISLPRQARDKHRESAQKKRGVFS